MNDFSIKNSSDSLTGAPLATKPIQHSASDSFGRMLMGSLNRVNNMQLEAEAKIENLANSKQTDIHQTMIAVEKASVSFELVMQIRNKLISAYDKIMRMPV